MTKLLIASLEVEHIMSTNLWAVSRDVNNIVSTKFKNIATQIRQSSAIKAYVECIASRKYDRFETYNSKLSELMKNETEDDYYAEKISIFYIACTHSFVDDAISMINSRRIVPLDIKNRDHQNRVAEVAFNLYLAKIGIISSEDVIQKSSHVPSDVDLSNIGLE